MTVVSERHRPQVLFVSLGETCQTAYQIRRFTQSGEAYFFDWLITPFDAYRSLYVDDAAFFKSHNRELVDHGGARLLDKGTNLKFQHEFKFKERSAVHAAPHSPTRPSAGQRWRPLKQQAKTLLTVMGLP